MKDDNRKIVDKYTEGNYLFGGEEKRVLMTSELEACYNKHDSFDLERLYNWLTSLNREPAQTKFTSGLLRNVVKEIEFLLYKAKKENEKN